MPDITLRWKFRCPQNQTAPVWFGLGASVELFFFSRAVLSFCGIKGSINKEQESSAARLGQWLLGVVPANRETWLFVLLVMESWDTSSGLPRAHRNSPVYPQTHFRSFYSWSCTATFSPSNFIPYF